LATPAAKQKFGPADAWADLLSLLTEHWQPHSRGTNTPAGIMHCFSGTVDEARRSLNLGFYLSFAGNLTYPAAKAIREAAAFAPADRILVETDAPLPSCANSPLPPSPPKPPPTSTRSSTLYPAPST
jgi:TatD DNase family protein